MKNTGINPMNNWNLKAHIHSMNKNDTFLKSCKNSFIPRSFFWNFGQVNFSHAQVFLVVYQTFMTDFKLCTKKVNKYPCMFTVLNAINWRKSQP